MIGSLLTKHLLMHFMEAVDRACQLLRHLLVVVEKCVLELEVGICLCDPIVELLLDRLGVTFDPHGLDLRDVVDLVARLDRHRLRQHVELVAVVVQKHLVVDVFDLVRQEDPEVLLLGVLWLL